MIENKKIFYFVYLLIIFFLIFEILFARKSIFSVFENNKNIIMQKQLLSKKQQQLESHERFIKNFDSIKEFQKIIIKDKLFYKDTDEKVLRYELFNPE